MLLTAAAAAAQTGTATVRGTVTDPQGQAVAGATVTLSNAERNFTRTQTTNDEGGYTFSLIPPGTYRLEAEATGFKKSVVASLNALVDTPQDFNVTMEVGAVTESVDVSAGVEAPLNTTDATIGTTFESRRVEELPLNARNVVGLLSLQPGVTRLGEVNGGRRDQANVTLDGIDVNEQQSGLDIVSGDAFSSVLRVTPSSVQEFRVVTSVPTANQGRSSGAQVSLVTKSGPNEWHGDLYHFHRNTVTTANDYFNNAAGRFTADDLQVQLGLNRVGEERLARPKLLRNIFGGSLGGPIKRDRLFFFYNYEGRRDASEVSVLQTVPTATLRQGIVRFPNVSGGTTTLTPADIARLFPATGGVNPVGLALLQTAPLPNTFETGDGLNTAGFRFNARNDVKLNTHIAKFDLNITDNQTMFVRGNYQDDFYLQPAAFPGQTAPSLFVNPKGFVVGHSWTINSSLVNNLRGGLTRQAFTQNPDQAGTAINFRFVFQPFNYTRGLSRTTPVWNITDDVAWIKGTHTVGFGGNVRFIRNNRVSFANAFDTAIVNPSFYANSGSSLSNPLLGSGLPADLRLSSGGIFDARAAVASVLGRFSQTSTSSTYDLEGNLQPVGTPTERTFATEEYEFYAQDTWRIRSNLTLTYGLRWSTSTPVYEVDGFQVKPTTSVSDIFERRRSAAEVGRAVNDLITVDFAGRANDRPGYYEQDWNNFAPTVSVAWSPDFGNNWFGRAIGREGRSVIRGGFRQVYDRIGSQLAVTFDLNNSLGFVSTDTVSANTINTTSRPGVLFTGLGQNIRVGNPYNAVAADQIEFPLTFPADESQRIEQTLDDRLVTPTQYTWNLSYGRELPKGFSFEASYVGRMGRNLGLIRDVMHLNNIRDPQSGQTWYEAAGVLYDLRAANVPFDSPNVPRIPFFENVFPTLGGDLLGDPSLTPSQAAYFLAARCSVAGCAAGEVDAFDLPDWTFVQSVLDDLSGPLGPNLFFHPQYAALGVFSTVGSADYHGGNFSLRQRFRNSFFLDFNYTFSKSMDDASSLESNAVLTSLIRQPLDLEAQRSVSDFDIRHNINANFLYELPIGRNRALFNNLPRVADAILGGWQMSGIFRYNSGLPFDAPSDIGIWATNWQLTSNGVRTRPIEADNSANVDGRPNVFADPLAAYRSFRNARAGEVGDRNVLRLPSFVTLDMGLAKTFKMWYAETHDLTFRGEVFNVTNTQRFGTNSSFGLNVDPQTGEPTSDFGRFTGMQTPVGEDRPGRVMQFALRYRF
ncbi:MAG TPA: carboxypeptidase-like regulatory domain-containing protein [Pyrinomonadaceae bacterium]|nr:carboxypeptidase-like regulatory domain-containing protein [Pyrinomonadaceae bacterium]